MSKFSRLSRTGFVAVALSSLALAAACGGGDDATATSEPTNTRTPAQTTATAVATSAASTSTAQANATATATTLAATSTASSQSPTPTATATPAGTPTPTPSPTATPQPTSTAIPFQTGGSVLNVTEGTLPLSPGSGSAIEYPAGVEVVNFRVSVTFSNPFHPETSPWDYGIKFRESNGSYQMLLFDETGDLNYWVGDGQTDDLVSSVNIPQFRTAGGQSNIITVLVLEEKARVFLDGVLVHTMDVGDVEVTGDISLVADFQNRSTIQGGSVRFASFFIDRAGLIALTPSGTLTKPSADEPAIGAQSLPTSAGYARVTLVSPAASFSADYSYGIKLTTQGTGFDNWLVFDDNKNWQHIRKSSDGAESVVTSGTAAVLDTREGFSNTIELINVDGQRKVYLNGTLLTVLVLTPDDLPFTIAPFAGYLPAHQTGGMETQFSDFIAWSVRS